MLTYCEMCKDLFSLIFFPNYQQNPHKITPRKKLWCGKQKPKLLLSPVAHGEIFLLINSNPKTLFAIFNSFTGK